MEILRPARFQVWLDTLEQHAYFRVVVVAVVVAAVVVAAVVAVVVVFFAIAR